MSSGFVNHAAEAALLPISPVTSIPLLYGSTYVPGVSWVVSFKCQVSSVKKETKKLITTEDTEDTEKNYYRLGIN